MTDLKKTFELQKHKKNVWYTTNLCFLQKNKTAKESDHVIN